MTLMIGFDREFYQHFHRAVRMHRSPADVHSLKDSAGRIGFNLTYADGASYSALSSLDRRISAVFIDRAKRHKTYNKAKYREELELARFTRLTAD